MSFDLAVWSEAQRPSTASATQTYEHMCEGERAGLSDASGIPAFHGELTGRYPDLSEDMDADTTEMLPWMGALTVSSVCVIMAISWRQADEVAPWIIDLADRHDLICFDPQDQTPHLPASLRRHPSPRLHRCIGLDIQDPDPQILERAVRKLSPTNWFLILEADDEHYLQIGLGTSAGVSWDQFALEHRDGSPDQHRRTVLRDPDQLFSATQGFSNADPNWDSGFHWKKLEL